MDDENIGYVFGVSAEKPALKYEMAFNWIALELQRDHEKWVEEYRNNPPNPKPESRLVKLGMFRADRATPELVRDLRRLFPENESFMVTTRFLRNALQRSGEFKCLGEIPLSRYSSEQPETRLNRAVWVFAEDATTAPLWA